MSDDNFRPVEDFVDTGWSDMEYLVHNSVKKF